MSACLTDFGHPLWLGVAPLILASGSAFRRSLLEAAEIPHRVAPALIDERMAETAIREKTSDPSAIARALAEAKALSVSGSMPAALVLGCDQTLALGHETFHKPVGREGAKSHLLKLSGKTHQLHSGMAIAHGGQTLWSHVESASLTMRPLSDAMIDAYLDAAGDAILASVGAYQLEKIGIHLFAKIEGDQSTIIGLPMLPLLAALRDLGVLRG
jgi:septum formation protein